MCQYADCVRAFSCKQHVCVDGGDWVNLMQMITIEDFAKVELKVAKVLTAERIEGSDKLLKLQINAGDVDEAGTEKNRQLIAGIGKAYAPETLVGKNIVIVANLQPRMLMGLESQGMILAATDVAVGTPVILTPAGDVAPGSKIK